MVKSLNRSMALVTFAVGIMNWVLSYTVGGNFPFFTSGGLFGNSITQDCIMILLFDLGLSGLEVYF